MVQAIEELLKYVTVSALEHELPPTYLVYHRIQTDQETIHLIGPNMGTWTWQFIPNFPGTITAWPIDQSPDPVTGSCFIGIRIQLKDTYLLCENRGIFNQQEKSYHLSEPPTEIPLEELCE